MAKVRVRSLQYPFDAGTPIEEEQVVLLDDRVVGPIVGQRRVAGRGDDRAEARVGCPTRLHLHRQQTGQVPLGLARLDRRADGLEGFLGHLGGLAEQVDLVVVLHLALLDHHVFDGDELAVIVDLVEGFFDGVTLTDGGEVGLEADTGQTCVANRVGQGRAHLVDGALALDDLQPRRLDGGLFGVAEVGDEPDVLGREDADAVIAREVGQVGQVGRVGQKNAPEIECIQSSQRVLLACLEVGLGFDDGLAGRHAGLRWAAEATLRRVKLRRSGPNVTLRRRQSQRDATPYRPPVTTRRHRSDLTLHAIYPMPTTAIAPVAQDEAQTMTAESLMEILRSLRSDGLLDGDGNRTMKRRKLPRVGVRARVTILPVDGDSAVRQRPAPSNVRLRDVGPRGIGFIADLDMKLGQKFLVLLHRERGGVIHLLAEVRRSRQVSTGSFEIGGAFHLNATREEVEGHLRSLDRAA